MRRYFAYGSNMNAVQMQERCPKSVKQENAVLDGYEFFINKRGVANIRQNPLKKVFGIVYGITEDDEKELDRREGVGSDIYSKQDLPQLNSFYYLAKENEEGTPRRGYLEKIIKECEDNDFPETYTNEIKGWNK